MIRAVIQAGFGNQLFQYATAYALAKDLGHPLELDSSFFRWYNHSHSSTAREYGLSLLQLDACGIRTADNKLFWKYKPVFSLPFHYLPLYLDGLPLVKEDIPNCRQDQRALFGKIGKRGASLFGFWQNTVYFDRYLHDLKRQFRPKYEPVTDVKTLHQDIERCKDSVGVHIRRGDFVDHGWDMGAGYYIKGMNYVKSQCPDAKFFIVTDDKKWAREQFASQPDVTIIDVQTTTCDIDEFFLLASCKHQIISESTFGWWAAYLNTNENKIIVVPQSAVGQIYNDKWHKI